MILASDSAITIARFGPFRARQSRHPPSALRRHFAHQRTRPHGGQLQQSQRRQLEQPQWRESYSSYKEDRIRAATMERATAATKKIDFEQRQAQWLQLQQLQLAASTAAYIKHLEYRGHEWMWRGCWKILPSMHCMHPLDNGHICHINAAQGASKGMRSNNRCVPINNDTSAHRDHNHYTRTRNYYENNFPGNYFAYFFSGITCRMRNFP